ncbi:MAG: hypothetical protein PUF97_06800 [Bifidobacteriaceae bacterium]|nr:hypothetical protein [Bifidobacteriaceae bacterium]
MLLGAAFGTVSLCAADFPPLRVRGWFIHLQPYPTLAPCGSRIGGTQRLVPGRSRRARRTCRPFQHGAPTAIARDQADPFSCALSGFADVLVFLAPCIHEDLDEIVFIEDLNIIHAVTIKEITLLLLGHRRGAAKAIHAIDETVNQPHVELQHVIQMKILLILFGVVSLLVPFRVVCLLIFFFFHAVSLLVVFDDSPPFV